MADDDAKNDTTQNKSLLVLSGWLVTATAFAIGVVLIIAESFLSSSPYTGLVIYMLIPMAISTGLGMVALGAFLAWRRRRNATDVRRSLPVIDLNLGRTRRRVLFIVGALTVFFTFSAVATYRAFLYTESVEFCGTLCHEVMNPEYVAYQNSPHARVPCVDCHIGEGANWYVKSKVSGMRQAFKVVAGTYELPIQVPIANLRPARETCEECHWPEKFSGSLERVEWHYWFDEKNTPSRYHLLMRIGGLNPQTGKSEGIHWHTSSAKKVWYWASDRQRLDIPWIEVEDEDGTRTVFKSSKWKGERPDPGEMRRMDCIDCHNRPAHIYKPPSDMLNTALANGVLDRDLPSLKRNGVEILSIDYPDRATARRQIAAEIERRYPVEGGLLTAEGQAELTKTLIGFYELDHFPEQGVSWKTYPDHIGHRVFPGCFRCHDDDHVADNGAVVTKTCNQCHDIVYQASGAAAYQPVKYQTQAFRHPSQGDMYEAGLCTDCHAADARFPGHAAGRSYPEVDYPPTDADAGVGSPSDAGAGAKP